MLEMPPRGVHVVAHPRTAGTDVATWRQHEMLDEKLAAALKQIGERFRSVRRLEDISLLDLDPGQCSALFGNPVA